MLLNLNLAIDMLRFLGEVILQIQPLIQVQDQDKQPSDPTQDEYFYQGVSSMG